MLYLLLRLLIIPKEGVSKYIKIFGFNGARVVSRVVASGRRNDDSADHGTLHCLPKYKYKIIQYIIPSNSILNKFENGIVSNEVYNIQVERSEVVTVID